MDFLCRPYKEIYMKCDGEKKTRLDWRKSGQDQRMTMNEDKHKGRVEEGSWRWCKAAARGGKKEEMRKWGETWLGSMNS